MTVSRLPGHAGKDATFANAELYMTTPGYFDALGTPRLAGRDFGSDTADIQELQL